MRPIHTKNLDGVVATGAGVPVDTRGHKDVTITVIATNVTDGGTVKLQSSPDGTNWADMATVSVTGNGTSYTTKSEIHKFIRSNVTARTDGTYSVYLTAASNPGSGGWQDR